ncbi:ArnT family glycosyltransferase [Candidatus Cloacimonadota bacterium]
MSKVNKKKKKTTFPHKKIENNLVNFLLKQNYWLILFYAITIITAVSSFLDLYKIKDIKNSYLSSQLGYLYNGQIIIYILLLGSFIYFGRKVFLKKEWQRKDIIIIIITFVCIAIIHIASFNPALDTNGDNAHYMLQAKAFVEHGWFYSIYKPGPELVFNPKYTIGFALLITPLYLIFGINIISIKILILILTMISVLLFYLIIKKMLGPYIAIVLTIVFGVHPMIVAYSSMIMTEIPYFFWNLLAIFLIIKYEEGSKVNYLYLICAALSIFMLYLTRAIGAGLALGVILYFVFKYNYLKKFLKQDYSFFKTKNFRKFIFLLLILTALFLLYQVFNVSSGDKSQASVLLDRISGEKIKECLRDLYRVLPQNIFAADIVRWKISDMNFKWFLILLIVLAGTIKSLLRKEIFAFYFIVALLLLIIAYGSYSTVVLSRYVAAFTPVLLYFLYLGIITVVSIFKSVKLSTISFLILFCLLLQNGFSGDALFIQRAHTGEVYSPAFSNYINAAKWAKDNLPEDSVIACRKERIFCLFSGLKGFKHTTYHDGNSPEHIKKREELFENKNADYIVIDSFNSSTIKFVLPWVQDNPQLFSLIHVVGDRENGPTYILKINKWWE